jgi:hypothetical protein
MASDAEAEIELSRAENGDECPICHSGTVVVKVSARTYWASCTGACRTVIRVYGQTDEIIRERWGYYNTQPVAESKTAEECDSYVPDWAKPLG